MRNIQMVDLKTQYQRLKTDIDKAIQKGVAFVPGSVFFADKKVSSFGRLNYTNSSLEQIKDGIQKLYEAYL